MSAGRGTTFALVGACMAYTSVQSLALPSLPVMEEQFGVSTSTSVWVLVAFLLTACVASPILGSLGDLYGRRQMLEISVACLVVGCIVAGFADSLSMVIAGRALQGVAGAVFPIAFSTIRSDLPPRQVGLALGLVSASFSVGGVLGLPLGGLLIDHLSWRWCYFVAAAVGVVALVSVRVFVRRGTSRDDARLDVAGALLLAAWLVLFLVGLAVGPSRGWLAPSTLGLVGGSLVVAALWWWWERRADEPIVDVHLMMRTPVLAATVAALALGWLQIGVISLLPVHLQDADGLAMSSSAIGMIYVPGFLVAMLIAPLGGRLAAKYGYRWAVAVGLMIGGAGQVIPASADRPWAFVALMVVSMVGVTLAFAAIPGWLVTRLPGTVAGSVTGMNTVMRSVGGAVGGQVSASMLTAGLSFAAVLWLSVGLVVLAGLFVLLVPDSVADQSVSVRQPRRREALDDAASC